MVGLLMVDRPHPADPDWLKSVEDTFGKYLLVPMTESNDRGIVCQMQIHRDSLPHLRQSSLSKTAALTIALKPLLDHPPNPSFFLNWDEESNLWKSRFAPATELPPELKEVLEQTLSPFKFESFLNTADEEQALILDQLANQDRLYLSFYDDDLTYRYTKTIQHAEQQWQQLDEIVIAAREHWQQIPADKRDFVKAKADFMRWYI